MWTCPKCERALKNPNQWLYCEKINIETLFEGKNPELVYIFDYLLSEIIDWANIAVSATPNCIVFLHRQTFLIFRPMKKELDIKFYSDYFNDVSPILKSTAVFGKYQNHIRLSNLEDVTPQVIELLRKSYELL